MRKLRINFSVPVTVLYVSIVASPQSAKLIPLSSAERSGLAARLDPGLLPEHARAPKPETLQSFQLVSKEAHAITIVPVLFTVAEPSIVRGISKTVDGCGVYVLLESGKAQFVWTVGDNPDIAGSIQCNRTIAVGAHVMSKSNPTLILLLECRGPDGTFREPKILDWNDKQGHYEINEQLSAAAENSPGELTIASIKRQLYRGN